MKMVNPKEQSIDDGYQLLACQYLREQLDCLARHTLGARQAQDVEDVHQARVASRRMRAALVMFAPCFPKKTIKLWGRHIKAITQGLGDARDKDVQILFVQRFLKGLGEDEKTFPNRDSTTPPASLSTTHEITTPCGQGHR